MRRGGNAAPGDLRSGLGRGRETRAQQAGLGRGRETLVPQGRLYHATAPLAPTIDDHGLAVVARAAGPDGRYAGRPSLAPALPTRDGLDGCPGADGTRTSSRLTVV